jgi:Flp pilus assembly protein TadD
MNWKDELAAIVEARTYGQLGATLPRLTALDVRHPNVAEINHQLAWTCDMLGRAAEALPYYEKAIALGLPPNELSGALVGLGSTLRVLGQSGRAVEVLRSARAQFPENREFTAFLALALHDAGRPAEAVQLLIETLCETTDDPGLTAYQRALRHAAANLGPGESSGRDHPERK